MVPLTMWLVVHLHGSPGHVIDTGYIYSSSGHVVAVLQRFFGHVAGTGRSTDNAGSFFGNVVGWYS